MALAYAGKVESEERLVRLAGTTRLGTLTADLVAAAIALGHRAEFRAGLPLDELERWLRGRLPAIALIDPRLTFRESQARAHFVVVYDIAKGRAAFHDPYVGPHNMIDLPAFMNAWSRYGQEAVRVWRR